MIPIKIYQQTTTEIQSIIEEFCMAVYSTMGPGGKNVIIDVGGTVPLVTKDGVTVAESIHFKDPYKNAIVSLIKEAARKTGQEVGDGTTTSTLLTERIILGGLSVLEQKRHHYEFFEALDEASMVITDYLNDSIVTVEDNFNLLESIVKISTNSDINTTELIMQAVSKAGADGIINVKRTDEQVSSISVTNGASINSNVFVNKPEELLSAELILVEGSITDVNEIVPVIKHASTIGPVIVVAKEFSDKVLKVIQINKLQYKANVIAVEAEGFGSNRMEILEVLSTLTGAKIFSTDKSTDTDIRDFYTGSASITNVSITQSEVVFTPPDIISLEDQKSISDRLKQAYTDSKKIADSSLTSHIKRKLSKFSNVATIFVGGSTEGEVIEREARVTDAVCAVSAAINGGVLPGGGRALQCATKALVVAIENEPENSIRRDAFEVMMMACTSPIEVLCLNVGSNWNNFKDDPLFLDENKTLDLIHLKIVDAFDEGILDPALVSINAVRNSVSVAKTILRTSVAIIPEYDG